MRGGIWTRSITNKSCDRFGNAPGNTMNYIEFSHLRYMHGDGRPLGSVEDTKCFEGHLNGCGLWDEVAERWISGRGKTQADTPNDLSHGALITT